MKLQSKLLGNIRLFGRRARAGVATAGTGDVDVADIPLTNMQSLAAELQQSAQQGQFEYPRNWTMVAKTLAALIVMLSIAHAGFVLIPLVTGTSGSLGNLFSWATLGVALGIAAAGLVAAFLVNLFPTVQVSPQGLGVQEITGWRYIPWKQISILRVMELRNRGRYVVLIPFTGATKPPTPAPMFRWLPVLLGATGWGGKGVLLTSDMKNFDKLLQLVVAYVVQASGQNGSVMPLEAFVDEDAVMPVAQFLLEPETEIVRIASNPVSKSDLYGVNTEEADPPVEWKTVFTRQLPIAMIPAFLLTIDVLMRHFDRAFMWQHAVWVVILLALGLAELPFVAMLVRAVGELMVGSGHFNRTIWAYLELQVPRVVMVILGTALVGMGAPAVAAQAVWLAGIVLTTLFTVRYVQRLYYMPVAHTLLAAIGTFIFQFSLLALYFGVR